MNAVAQAREIVKQAGQVCGFTNHETFEAIVHMRNDKFLHDSLVKLKSFPPGPEGLSQLLWGINQEFDRYMTNTWTNKLEVYKEAYEDWREHQAQKS